MLRLVGTNRRSIAALVLAMVLAGCAASPKPKEKAPEPISTTPNGANPASALYQGLGAAEIELASAAMQSALERNPSRQTLSWRSETTSSSGAVTPIRTFRATEGFFCREFEESVTMANKPRVALRLACRVSDGVWHPASHADPL